jgi:argininosuccinate synthase
MAAALGRPLIAKKLVEIAAIEQAGAIAYGWRGRDGDRARIERAARALNPEIQVIAPPRRAAAPAGASGCCVDTNLWGRSIESGAIQDPWTEAPEDVFAITKAAPDAPNTPAHVEIAFEQGVPTAINGVPMALTELVESLTIIAGQHGVGRIDKIENRPDGVKSRVICEAPAAVVLHAAHGALRAFVSSRELERLTRAASVAYADLIHDGSWFTPMRAALDAFNVGVQQHVTGVVRMRLFKGLHTVVGRALPAQRAAADTAARTSQPVNNA